MPQMPHLLLYDCAHVGPLRVLGLVQLGVRVDQGHAHPRLVVAPTLGDKLWLLQVHTVRVTQTSNKQ